MAVKLVVFDMAGTTVDDSINGLPLVAVGMQEAFRKHGLEVSLDKVNEFRGMEKKDAIKNVLQVLRNQQSQCDYSASKVQEDDLVNAIFKDFKESLNSHLQFIDKEIPGTSETFRILKSKGVKISVGSGFPHSVVEEIVNNLGWEGMVDYVSSAEREGHGRPNPAMIHAAMKYCCVEEVRSVVKVGDTKMDVQEGRNAGCWTVAVLTGTQSEECLKDLKPDFIIDSVVNLPSVLSQIEVNP
jgi:phosphonatase-like hydrolase